MGSPLNRSTNTRIAGSKGQRELRAHLVVLQLFAANGRPHGVLLLREPEAQYVASLSWDGTTRPE